MNASVVGDSIVIRKGINLGIAMDTDEGLLVPVIKAAEGMSVVGIARAIEALRRKIAEKKISADDLVGHSSCGISIAPRLRDSVQLDC